ncbi:hypothetical protein SASPL_156234 [Salvia splendens]|uniref:E1 ubiquitin-activating enzyme n=1 Tax=Salvia splendens TaxID=180675 RepID=A0A8X8YWC0_SALSN|nr:hypothetical protein SASPL_156234 [Salvia splendens]
MGIRRVFSSLLHYMLPRKRAGEGEAVNVSDSDSVKRQRVVSSTENSSNQAKNNSSDGVGKSNCSEPTVTDMAFDNGTQRDIDEDLHSRQLAVYGRETMRRLFASNVFVSGMQGLGVEIAKNLILAGVKSVTLHDEGSVELWDMSSNFVFTEKDLGKNRALASVQKLQELNNAVTVLTLTTKLTKETTFRISAVVFTDINLDTAIEFSDYCHNHQPPIAFIKTESMLTVKSLIPELLHLSVTTTLLLWHVWMMKGLSFRMGSGETAQGAELQALKEALKDTGDFLLSDFSKFDRPPLLHLAFQALDKFVSETGRYPVAGCEEDAQKLISITSNMNESQGDGKLDDINPKLLRHFAFGARAVLNPMAAMFGGIVGQEVMKACSGKFHPLFSGCEFLKNLALMGVSCGSSGKLTITDDDVIEKSNLSRQFLFRDWNIGQPKSTVAASAALAINLQFHIEALQNRVGSETENVFHDAFWENLSVVINALDNVNARLYVDQRCLYFQKPLLESGTLGAKCNTQMVIPHLTENYGASRDPPEKQAPMFEDYFANRVKQLAFTFPEDAATSTGAPFWSAPKRFPQAVDQVIVPDFQPRSDAKIVTDEKATSLATASVDDAAVINDLIVKLEKCCQALPPNFRMKPIQFEKHLQNMRARNYSIPEVDKLKAKFIAGRIIPAIATSTAMATGLVCLELYKVIDGSHKVEDYRNTICEPCSPAILHSRTSASQVCLLYNSMFPRHKDRMDKKISDLVRDVAKVELPPYRNHVDVVCGSED